MEVKDMISLYIEEGITASDILTLNKAGYTPEIIKELKNNGMQSDDIRNKAEEQHTENEQNKQLAEEAKKESEALNAQLEEAHNKIAELEKKIESIQADNRGKDMSGELSQPDQDRLKDITDYVSSLM